MAFISGDVVYWRYNKQLLGFIYFFPPIYIHVYTFSDVFPDVYVTA